jgi:hypothetical protein
MLWITGDSGPLTGENPQSLSGGRPALWILGTNR